MHEFNTLDNDFGPDGALCFYCDGVIGRRYMQVPDQTEDVDVVTCLPCGEAMRAVFTLGL